MQNMEHLDDIHSIIKIISSHQYIGNLSKFRNEGIMIISLI